MVAASARARAPTLVPRSAFQAAGSAILAAQEHISGCPGAQLSITWVRLPGSTFQAAQEHASVFRLPGSTFQVTREHTLALPGCGCPGARFNGHWKGVDGARIAMFPNYDRTEFTKALPQRGFMKLR